eukprot:TRINITY_DN10083_c0_g1_i1.p1 TRINITY_DN10083_c0_g1~~TRINITY_DN10083_c0_g1_i1.p1  ORF type:complete len:732 (-),score=223.56 TRINITY_DN10083_c0_g1_i1:193-2340(-)
MPARKCQSCGSTDIESDSVRADAVCTKCGTVLESGIIVSDVQFEENAHGGSSAIGTFVSADRKGGSNTFGGTFHTGIGRESREITLKNARKKIVALAQQLRLRPDHIDMAFYFFKLALAKHLTRGRKSSHVIAACVYITCRTEGTSHMLIDFSDVLQVDVYELGRTYLRLSQALCINIPAMDPCLYVMRFAHKLEFGDKTHEVSMTALRLVSRMKKDWIHFGRRPSGLCGAALLIASRLHEFCRTVTDVIKVVKVHESTLRKRLTEFGETSASQLTLDEFMNVDLDAMTEEMDPPSFKAARKKDRELLEKLEVTDLDKELSELEDKIEKELEERRSKVRGPYSKFSKESSPETSANSGSDTDGEREIEDTQRFIHEQTLNVIGECLEASPTKIATQASQAQLDSLLMPPPFSTPSRTIGTHSMSSNPSLPCSPGLGLKDTVEEYLTPTIKDQSEDRKDEEPEEELDITGIDDGEIDSYLMSPAEIENKTNLWMMVNKEYLKEQEIKIKKEKELREEMIKNGIDPDKKKKIYKKKSKSNLQSNGTALEAIEKIVQEKKMSTKINYDVLKSLNMGFGSPKKSEEISEIKIQEDSPEINKLSENTAPSSETYLQKKRSLNFTDSPSKRLKPDKRPNLLPKASIKKDIVTKMDPDQSSMYDTEPIVESGPIIESGPVEPCEEDDISDFSDEDEPMKSAAELLSQQFGIEAGYGMEEEFY